MAYTKQTWTNDVSKVNATRMTHIEDGIYDNSTNIDTINNNVNPSGTATTTQTDFTEGQLTQKLGLKYIKMKGQTSQYTTNGYQLFDINNTPSANRQYVINNGFKLTKGTNRTIQISLPNPIPAGTYYISADVINSTLSGNNKINVSFKDVNNADVVGNVTFLTNGAVTTTAEVKDLYFFILNTENDGVTITLDNIMLNSGSTKKNFEQYTGKKASPNPDYPQDVQVVTGSNVIKICNKNLCPTGNKFAGVTNQWCNQYGEELGTVQAIQSNSNYIMLKPNTTYKFYIHEYNNISTIQIIYLDNTNNLMTYANYSVSTNVATFTTTSYTKVYIRAKATTNADNTYFIGQLEEGTATSYIAHKEEDYYIDLPVVNKLPYPYVQTTRTAEGITYTDLGDGRIKINGTATANSAFKLLGEASSQVAIPGNYVYGGVNSNVRVRAMNKTSGGTYTTLGSSIGSSTKIDKSTYETGYVEISIASGTTVNNLIITPMLSDNEVNAYTPYRTNPIELCKIGDYQDYIYKNNGKWYIHKEIGKKTVTNGDDFSLYQQNVGNNVYQYRTANNYLINAKLNPDPFNIEDIAYSNYFAKKNGINNLNNYYFTITGNGALAINTPYASINSLKTWLAGIDLKFYYELATATEEEITYEPLLRQLDKLDKIGLYDISNISQDNSDMKMLLDFIICNDNYNGLREFIRA